MAPSVYIQCCCCSRRRVFPGVLCRSKYERKKILAIVDRSQLDRDSVTVTPRFSLSFSLSPHTKVWSNNQSAGDSPWIASIDVGSLLLVAVGTVPSNEIIVLLYFVGSSTKVL